MPLVALNIIFQWLIIFYLSGNDFDDNSANYFAEAISVSILRIWVSDLFDAVVEW